MRSMHFDISIVTVHGRHSDLCYKSSDRIVLYLPLKSQVSILDSRAYRIDRV